MAYAVGNPKTKKELKAWVAEGRKVRIFSPGPFPVKYHGPEFLEGPQYPAPHSWYAQVELADGVVVKVK